MIWLVTLSILLISLYLSAQYNWWRPKVNKQFPRVLMYHSINNEVTPGLSADLVVSPKQFESQLKYLSKKGYSFYKISELVEQPVKGKSVALTFDDGFKDNFTQMLPILEKYKAKATIYLAPDIKDIEVLNKSDIQAMLASGLIEFGAHTMNHINLAKANADISNDEIIASKAAVEKLTGQDCNAFAYPFGRYTDQTVQQLKAAGFKNSVTVRKGIEKIADVFRIKRISILGRTNLLQFHIALSRGRYRL